MREYSIFGEPCFKMRNPQWLTWFYALLRAEAALTVDYSNVPLRELPE
jgi:hypothetical protein